ncbi:hypothetical protein JMN32_05035 [Fulvivirga sp. 29W222]|uniref:Uncharacterized protein n=1 Tax=Fulvivirga marina TaxID=2494733 RepID=A0A937FZB8_9BACT|nr:hypothetical protein [Fulvivirga marina]MBL6445661.1 hypothetical protein [Fulvivirga marina]
MQEETEKEEIIVITPETKKKVEQKIKQCQLLTELISKVYDSLQLLDGVDLNKEFVLGMLKGAIKLESTGVPTSNTNSFLTKINEIYINSKYNNDPNIEFSIAEALKVYRLKLPKETISTIDSIFSLHDALAYITVSNNTFVFSQDSIYRSTGKVFKGDAARRYSILKALEENINEMLSEAFKGPFPPIEKIFNQTLLNAYQSTEIGQVEVNLHLIERY